MMSKSFYKNIQFDNWLNARFKSYKSSNLIVIWPLRFFAYPIVKTIEQIKTMTTLALLKLYQLNQNSNILLSSLQRD